MAFSWGKYIIFDSVKKGKEYQIEIDSLMIEDGFIKEGQTYSEVKKIGWEVEKTSGRAYVVSPPEKYRGSISSSFLKQSMEENPALIEENNYLIYYFLNEDGYRKFRNFTEVPISLDYKKDVNIRFAKKIEFDKYGFVTTVTYYETVNVTINETNLAREYEYVNEILKVSFEWNIGIDGYISNRTVNRQWKKEDGTYSSDHIKTKDYSIIEGQNEGIRRRRNVANLLKQNIVGAIMEVEFIDSNPLNIIEAQNLGIVPLNEIKESLLGFEENNSINDLVNAINNLSIETYPFLNKKVLSLGGISVKDLSKKIITDSKVI